MNVANQLTINSGDQIIFAFDEYGDGNVGYFDGVVLVVYEKEALVSYLSGYRSRDDRVPFGQIAAKLDNSQPFIKLDPIPYSGHFIVFGAPSN